MSKKEVIPIIPFIFLTVILSNTWFIIATTNYFATIKHYLGLGLFLMVTLLYAFRWKYGVILTGIFLILASFNVIAIFPVIKSSSYFIKIGEVDIATPFIQWKALLLLILFFFCTWRFLYDLYIKNKRDETSTK